MSIELKKRAQATFEYISIVALAMFLIVAGVMLFFTFSQRSSEDITSSQVESIGNLIVTTSEKVYYLGGDTWETIRVNIPNNVRRIYLFNKNELVIQYDAVGARSEAIFFSNINMTSDYSGGNISANPHPGVTVIRISAKGSEINISEVQ